MNLILKKDRTIMGGTYILAVDSENNSTDLSFSVEDETLWGKSAFIEFLEQKKTTQGIKVSTTDGTFSYTLPNGLLQEGYVTMQVVIRGENHFVWKSLERIFNVTSAINISADMPVEYPDWLGEAQKILDGATSATGEIDEAVAKADTAVDNANIAIGKADTAIDKANTANATANTAIDKANTAITNANEASDKALNVETEIEGKESLRETAEQSRATAEDTRKANEDKRQEDEATRNSNEDTRKSNETARIADESIRKSNETGRQNNETARKNNELTRQSAETSREENESARKADETARKNAETSRVSAENVRKQNEQDRETSEQGRVTAENNRVTAEDSRVVAEQGRKNQFDSWHDEIASKIPKISSPIKDNIPLIAEDGSVYDSGISYYALLNKVHWTITATGSDTPLALGGDAAGLTDEQLMNLYPFNDTYVETITPYASDKTTLLTGEDKFVNMPNYWYWLENGESGSFVFHFANYKVSKDFKQFISGYGITRLHLAKYLADTDGTYLRSRTGYEPVVNMNQVTALSKMPYVKKDDGTFRRCEYMDYRVWSAYFWLATASIRTRNSQSKYYGMAGWGWDSTLGNWNNIPSQLRLNGTTDAIGAEIQSGEITSYVDADEATQAIVSGKRPCRILGIENPYGLIWQNVYGFYHKADEIYAYDGIEELTSSQINPNSPDFAATDTGGKCSGAGGWQTTIGEHNGFTYPTSITGGAENKYSSDYYWYTTNATIAFVGGNWYNGGSAGLSCLSFSGGFGTAGVDLGFRLSYVS